MFDIESAQRTQLFVLPLSIYYAALCTKTYRFRWICSCFYKYIAIVLARPDVITSLAASICIYFRNSELNNLLGRKMLTLRRGEQLRARLQAACCRYLSAKAEAQATALSTDSEYTAEPEYPVIRDLSYKGRKVQSAKDWHDEIRRVATVEEKMIKVNMPRYYGYKVVDLNDTKMPYNALPLMQHYTRTVLQLEQEQKQVAAPDAKATEANDTKQNQNLDAFVKAAREDVIEALEYAHDVYK